MSCEKKNQVRYRSLQKGTQNNTPIEQAMRFRVLMDYKRRTQNILYFITVYRLRHKVGRTCFDVLDTQSNWFRCVKVHPWITPSNKLGS